MMTQQQRRHASRKRLLTLLLVTAGLILLAGRLAAAPGPRSVLLGGWADDEALRFDPFTLTTAPGGPVGAAGALGSGAGPAGREPAGGDLGDAPDVRIPYRPVLRSPFRPPL